MTFRSNSQGELQMFIVTNHKYKVHETREAAEAECARLNEKFPYQSFQVLSVWPIPNPSARATGVPGHPPIDLEDSFIVEGNPDTRYAFNPQTGRYAPANSMTIRASDGRPDDPFCGQAPVDDVAKKYPA